MMKIYLSVFVLILLISVTVTADNTEKSVTEWLVLDPVQINYPAKSESKDRPGDLLKFSHLEITEMWPSEGDRILWEKDINLEWQDNKADQGNLSIDSDQTQSSPHLAYAVFYLQAERWMNLYLKITSRQPFQIFYNGKMVKEKMSYDSTATDSVGSVSEKIEIETGKHIIIVKTIKHDRQTTGWQLSASISVSDDSLLKYFKLSTDPEQAVSLRQVLDIPLISDISLSADGKFMAVKLSQRNIKAETGESWLEIRYTANGKLYKSFRGHAKLSDFKWAPEENRFAFTNTKKKKTTLWIADLNSGISVPLKSELENFSTYQWAPDASYLLYSIKKKPEAAKDGLKKLQGMPDHWPAYRDKSSWYKLSYPGGTSEQITGNNSSIRIMDIGRDAQRILFYDLLYDYEDRPFDKMTLFLLDLNSMKMDSVWSGRWLNSATFSPDGKKLLCRGGPSLFNGLGVNVPDNVIPNEYDAQAYIFDLSNAQAEAISRNFDPTIKQAVWNTEGIFMIAGDKDYQHLYHYNPDSRKYKKIETEIDVINKMEFASQAPVAIVSGTSTAHPARVAVVNLKDKSARIILYPARDFFKNTKLGEVKTWTFDSKFGHTVDGRVYFPPDFDPDKKYPCIVHYYAGTSPISRAYGGRYPNNFYTANGYVVYVINPAGATGYGQEYSALHVNNWGKMTGEQIIEGTKKFLAAHPFVDPERVGCIGASYGGFMTMYLVAKTDIFASAISHAGISSLSSYWGEGYWGYLYSATATAHSYPWNRKDIYVDQSPLFLADSIHTPLLLLHGADDTNVPPGESRQLYTALKLLKRPVELIEVSGQNHWIMQYDKRKRWTNTIIAWFDYWLKDQPEWWDNLYPAE